MSCLKMKRGNVVLPRFGWDGPAGGQAVEILESKSHGGRHDTQDQTENAGKFQEIAHGILGLGFLFKWRFISEIRGGSGTLIK